MFTATVSAEQQVCCSYDVDGELEEMQLSTARS
jgi:hypothetical protein